MAKMYKIHGKVQWLSWVQSFFQTKSGAFKSKKGQQASNDCQQKIVLQINAPNIVKFAN